MVRIPPSNRRKMKASSLEPGRGPIGAGEVAPKAVRKSAAKAGPPTSERALPPLRPASGVSAGITGGESASRTPVRLALRELHAQLDDAASAVPSEGQASLKHALTTSAERVLVSLDLGRITPDEAERATRMLSEMMNVLVALEHGRVQVTPAESYANSDMQGYEVKTTTGDVLRVAVRPLGNERGEARVKLENILDDGAPVQQQDRLMIRFDLEGSSPTSPKSGAVAMLDLQFGNERFNKADPREKLNKRIHGVLLDESGQPLKNRGGSTVPDHHFRTGVPRSLDDAEAFSRFVGSFLDELEQHRSTARDGT